MSSSSSQSNQQAQVTEFQVDAAVTAASRITSIYSYLECESARYHWETGS